MNHWTQAARRTLDDCLKRNRRRFAAEGAEADEVAADLRRHLEFEASEERLAIVTESDVRRILAKVDPVLVETVPTKKPDPEASPELPDGSSEQTPGSGGFGRVLLWTFGVLLPLGTLVAEFFLRMCAVEFFDPLPTAMHVALVALVPLANTAALLCLGRQREIPPAGLWWLHASALGVAATYGVLFLPMAPFAFVGIAYYGFGLLPLSPLIAWICGLVLGQGLRVRARRCEVGPPTRLWLGWAAAVVLLVAPVLPSLFTRHWLHVAATGGEAERTAAVRQLRRFGSEDQVLMAAYGQFGRGLTELGWERPCSAEEAQQIYFRVTGRPFNAVRPPLSRVRGAGRTLLDEFEWDGALGGETVAGQVSGLSLLSSRLDASAHAAEGWGYTEWTLEFRNDHPRRQREARALVQLPPGGVVSRVTLWVNGEEREAAFAGRGDVRAAYQEVAVKERRDPILVTTAGPDRVLVQCFPVPANGGVMKVRLGVTAPLQPLTAGTRAFLWPRIVERNFAIHDDVRHHAWFEAIEGRAELPDGWRRDAGGANTAYATVTETASGQSLRSVRLQTPGPSGAAWALDDRGPTPAWVRQRLETSTVNSSGRLALVLDAGRGAEDWFAAVRSALEKAHGRGELAIWISSDGAHQVVPGQEGALKEVASALGRWNRKFEGGHDPVPALEAALDWAGEVPGGTVLWIHGPQPVALREAGVLRQRLERSGSLTALWDVPAVDGPNRLAGSLEGVGRFHSFARIGTLESDLGRYFDQWSGLMPEFRWIAERTETAPDSPVTASRHLVRLWAAETIERLQAERRREEAVNMAARWQLVTPVSGAVVLETAEQFARHGLSPADPLTIPSVVPEPETWVLLLVGLGVLGWIRRNR